MARKKRLSKKRTAKSKFHFFNSKGNIAFKAIIGVVIIGSILLVSGFFPKGQITPKDPNAPKYRIDPDQDNSTSRSNLQLKTIAFQSCSNVTAVNMLLDTTGSMSRQAPDGQTKMRKLQDATISFLNNFTDDSVLGIQTFSSQAIRELVRIDYYKNVKDGLENKIRRLPADGNTPTTEGLRFALERVKEGQARFPDRNFTFIFVSDGEPFPESHDPRLAHNAPDPSVEIKNLGVTVYSIGILEPLQIQRGEMKRLLEHIASDPGKAYIAPDGNQLSQIYEQIGFEMCKKAGGN